MTENVLQDGDEIVTRQDGTRVIETRAVDPQAAARKAEVLMVKTQRLHIATQVACGFVEEKTAWEDSALVDRSYAIADLLIAKAME